MIDLHSHSNLSDGTDAPAELVRKAYAAGVRILALTDHDCTDGLAEAESAAAELRGMEVVPGVELSCLYGQQEIHILGYFLDPTEPTLQSRLVELREARLTRADRMLDKLDTIGIRLNRDRVREIAGQGSFGRPHIARALMEVGQVGSISEAFDRYLTSGKPAYVERMRLEVPEAITLIRRAGGAASIAHPLDYEDLDLPELLQAAAAVGLAGLEAHYGRYRGDQIDRLVALAESYNLVPTGGSDYHGVNKQGEGVALGDADVPIGSLTRLRARRDAAR